MTLHLIHIRSRGVAAMDRDPATHPSQQREANNSKNRVSHILRQSIRWGPPPLHSTGLSLIALTAISFGVVTKSSFKLVA